MVQRSLLLTLVPVSLPGKGNVYSDNFLFISFVIYFLLILGNRYFVGSSLISYHWIDIVLA